MYLIIPRDNFEQNLPLTIMRCGSRGMLKYRVTAIQDTMMYEPRYLRHLVMNIRIEAGAADEIEARQFMRGGGIAGRAATDLDRRPLSRSSAATGRTLAVQRQTLYLRLYSDPESADLPGVI